jgi:hypothetical protein
MLSLHLLMRGVSKYNGIGEQSLDGRKPLTQLTHAMFQLLDGGQCLHELTCTHEHGLLEVTPMVLHTLQSLVNVFGMCRAACCCQSSTLIHHCLALTVESLLFLFKFLRYKKIVITTSLPMSV